MSEEKTYKRGGTIALVTKEREPSMLKVNEDRNSAIVVNAPIASMEWAGVTLEVRCANIEEYEECIEIAGGKEPEKHLQDLSISQLVKIAHIAFGGKDCPLSEADMRKQPKPFLIAMREAVQFFFWDGPTVDREQTTEDQELEETTPSEN